MNLLWAILGGVGVALILSAYLYKPKEKDLLAKEVKRVTVQDRIKTLLRQAHAPIEVSEFLMISVGIGTALALAAFFVTGGLLVPLVLFFSGALLYYQILIERRHKMTVLYEEALTSVVIIIKEHFRVYGFNLPAALEMVAKRGPEITQQDFWGMALAFKDPNAVDMQTINDVLTYRNSPNLTKLVEAMLIYQGVRLESLPQALAELQPTMEMEVEIAAENAALVHGPKKNLMLICGIAILVMLVMILTAPMFRQFYATFLGQFTLLVALILTLSAYLLGVRIANRASMTRPYVVKFPEQRTAVPTPPSGVGQERSGQ